MAYFRCCVFFLAFCSTVLAARRDWKEGEIRLVGGPRRYLGTVLIIHNGRWGAICDELWGMNDAHVACRQLGYSFAIKATTRSEFGPGRRRMWISQVRCSGKEDNITSCPFRGFDRFTRYKCPGRFRSAGVICSAAITTQPTTTTTTTTTTTPTTTTPTTTTTTPTTTASTTITTTTTTTTEDMKITAAGLPAPNVKFPFQNANEHENMTKTSQNTTEKDEIDANDKEAVFASTIAQNSSVNVPLSDEEKLLSESIEDNYGNITVNTSSTNSSTIGEEINGDQEQMDAPPLLADAPVYEKFEKVEIKLAGGRYKWEGHLQIKVNDEEWGTICSDHWTIKEAMASCNQLQTLGKAKQALQASFFGGSKMTKTFYRIECGGRETNLAECKLTRSDKTSSCSKATAVAGVVCSHHLPDLIPSLRALEDTARLQDQPLYYLRCSMEENCLASSAYVIKNTSLTWRNNLRRLLRFSTVVFNRGLADFKPYKARGQWEWHQCHMHYHSMEVFAHYDIMNSSGARLAEGSKASFCLEDTTCDAGVKPQYNCRGHAEQGLSVNCSDNYNHDIDCQWIDITDIKPGDYTFLMEVNPSMLVAESNYDNNVVSCHLYYNGFFASLRRCHYESLLDYRQPMKIP